MYKTLIQLFLLLILILIIFFISNKYFYTEDKINEVNNDTSLNTEKNNLLNNDLVKPSIIWIDYDVTFFSILGMCSKHENDIPLHKFSNIFTCNYFD